MDGWIEVSIELPPPGAEVELMGIAVHKGKYLPDQEEVWHVPPDVEVTGEITHWRPLDSEEK